MEKSLRVLVIGGSGFLGKKIVKILSSYHEVISTYNKNPIPNGIKLDIFDPMIFSRLSEINPDVIISTVGISNIEKCEQRPILADRINTESLCGIVFYCMSTQTRLIWISTDYVFDGDSPPYDVYAKRNPLNKYGMTKVAGENFIMDLLNNYAIIRCDILYGYNNSDDKETFPVYIINQLKNHKSVCVNSVHIKYPTFIDDIAKSILKILHRNKGEIIHLSSRKGITKYQWAKIVADEFCLNPTLIFPDNSRSVLRPLNPKMVLSPESKGFVSVKKGLNIIRKQMM